MSAIEFLKSEHKKFHATFREILTLHSISLYKRTKLLKQLLHDLDVHETMEQKMWYPYLECCKSTIQKMIREEKQAAKVLHQVKRINAVVLKLSRTEKSKRVAKLPSIEVTLVNKWATSVTKLQTEVLHHAHDEETLLFPKVKRDVSHSILVELANQMKVFKRSRQSRH